jgi:hypothetical protein
MRHGEMSWENPAEIERATENFYLFIRFKPPHSNQLPDDKMYTTDAPLTFIPDAFTIFVIIFSILLIIAWIALLL